MLSNVMKRCICNQYDVQIRSQLCLFNVLNLFGILSQVFVMRRTRVHRPLSRYGIFNFVNAFHEPVYIAHVV